MSHSHCKEFALRVAVLFLQPRRKSASFLRCRGGGNHGGIQAVQDRHMQFAHTGPAKMTSLTCTPVRYVAKRTVARFFDIRASRVDSNFRSECENIYKTCYTSKSQHDASLRVEERWHVQYWYYTIPYLTPPFTYVYYVW